MDYKYIEQLLEKYYGGETSLEEEKVLRAFFSQRSVPSHLEKHKVLFDLMAREAAIEPLDTDFDQKVMGAIGSERPRVKAVRIRLRDRMMPLLKSVATVAVIVALATAAQMAFQDNAADDEPNYSGYTDTYSDPAAAYNEVSGALMLISQGISRASADSVVAMRSATPCDSILLE